MGTFSKKGLGLASLVVLLVAATLYFRSYTVFFPQLKEQARSIIEQQLRQQVTQEIMARFPQFNELARANLIKLRFAEYKRQNKAVLASQTQQLYRQFRDRFQDERGQTYLMELDCWHWSRYVENVLRLGHPGDQVVHGRQLDLFMLAPLGSYLHWDNFLFYFSAALYRMFVILHPVALFTFLFYLPLLFSAVFCICLFFFAYRLGKLPAAIISCLLVCLSPIFIPRSCAGWFDKDILNLLFPLLVVWLYAEGSVSRTLRSRALFSCAAAFWVGIFCFNWTFWWFIPAIVIGYELCWIVSLAALQVFLKRECALVLRERVFSTAVFAGASLFWVLLFCGRAPLEELYRQMRLALILNKPLMSTIWPNVYSTVGELRRLSVRDVAFSVGGPFVFSFSVTAFLSLLLRQVFFRAYAGVKRETLFLLSLWAVAMLFASSRGIRFVVFLVVPLGVFLGWAVNELFEFFRPWYRRAAYCGCIAVIVGLAVFFAVKAHASARTLFPLMNDTWYKVLSIVSEKSPKETILNSWWDFGDWFKVVGKRRVIFDGQSQDTPQAYWMAKALLSNDEKESVAILRMLNNGGNRAFETINEYLKDPLQAVLLLENVLRLDPPAAQERLRETLPAGTVQQVFNLLYARPPRACFIVDPTLQAKMAAISYLGNWDFSKVFLIQNFSSQEKDRIIDRLASLGRNVDDVQRAYQEAFIMQRSNIEQWLSRTLLIYGGIANGQERDGVVFFDNGLVYSPREQVVRSSVGRIPRSFFVLREEEVVEVSNPNANMNVSVLIFAVKDAYKCVLLDRELGKSLFSRLYYFNGKGLKYFSSFIDADEGNDYIRVFYLAW